MFPKFLANLLLNNGVFSCLRHFVDVLEKLHTVRLCSVFKALSEADLTSTEPVVLNLGLEDSLEFYNSPLFRDYEAARVSALLGKAKGATTAKERLAALGALSTVSTEGQAKVLEQVAMAKSFFSPEVLPIEQLRYALSDSDKRQTRVEFACSFADLTAQARLGAERAEAEETCVSWRAVAVCLKPGEVPATIEFPELKDTLLLVGQAGLKSTLRNPVLILALDFLYGAGALDACRCEQAKGEDEKCSSSLSTVLAKLALSARLRRPEWHSGDETVKICNQNLRAAVKLLTKVFGNFGVVETPAAVKALCSRLLVLQEAEAQEAAKKQEEQRLQEAQKRRATDPPLQAREAPPDVEAAALEAEAAEEPSSQNMKQRLDAWFEKAVAKTAAAGAKAQVKAAAGAPVEPYFEVGHKVMLVAVRGKDWAPYKNHTAKITALLKKHAWVQMLSGKHKGEAVKVPQGTLQHSTRDIMRLTSSLNDGGASGSGGAAPVAGAPVSAESAPASGANDGEAGGGAVPAASAPASGASEKEDEDSEAQTFDEAGSLQREHVWEAWRRRSVNAAGAGALWIQNIQKHVRKR